MEASATDSAIWPRLPVWAWLAVNILWLNTLVPAAIVLALGLWREPTWPLKLVGLVTVIVVIPFVGTLGFALLSYRLLVRGAHR